MAIVNPTPADFIANQERALDYQQYRSSSDILRAVAEFYKISVFKSTDAGVLNYITTGLLTTAQVADSQVQITVSEGSGVLDNQPVLFTDDFEFEYDEPSADTTYYIYVTYKYVAEYPPNYAYLEVYTSELTNTDHTFLLARVKYDATNKTVTVDNSPRNSITNDAIETCGNGSLYPVKIATDSNIQAGILYLVDTSNGVINLTLPATPDKNSAIAFYDVSGTFDENALNVQVPSSSEYTINKDTAITIDEKRSYVAIQLTDPSEDKNWYVMYADSEVIDGGTF